VPPLDAPASLQEGQASKVQTGLSQDALGEVSGRAAVASATTVGKLFPEAVCDIVEPR